MKLDIYTHIFPMTFFNKMEEVVEDKGPIKRWLNIPVLYDVDARLRMMEQFGDYQQVLTLSAPPIEFIAGPDVTPGLARIANDGMAEICKQHPDRFPCFIASLPMNNTDEAVREIDRAVGDLDARGIQIFSNVNGRPLDEPEFYPIFERMAQLDLPIYLHPARGPNFADYRTEQRRLQVHLETLQEQLGHSPQADSGSIEAAEELDLLRRRVQILETLNEQLQTQLDSLQSKAAEEGPAGSDCDD